MAMKRDRWVAFEESDGTFTVTINGRQRASGLEESEIARVVRRYRSPGASFAIERRDGTSETRRL